MMAKRKSSSKRSKPTYPDRMGWGSDKGVKIIKKKQPKGK